MREHVLAYGGFRGAGQIAHRVLPLNVAVLVIDLAGGARTVTGPSSGPVLSRDVRWGFGVTVAFRPAGVRALLGVPMPELAGRSVPLADLVGSRESSLVTRLASAPGWGSRFAILDSWLIARSSDTSDLSEMWVMEAWRRLQRGPTRVGTVATSLGVSRRRLESTFQRRIGLTPGTVARVARFQRATDMLTMGTHLPRLALDCGYADQPHLTRETKALSGLTPTELRRALHRAMG
ncbi:helix-turn-helix domain-containing protein [Actinoplanes sp. CA-015351]|uniref:AraC family transcriptional regulator n=1 Tax=Actinoplanes sp. CA-015351 TaxID=3239897 RepID=UPI003D998720